MTLVCIFSQFAMYIEFIAFCRHRGTGGVVSNPPQNLLCCQYAVRQASPIYPQRQAAA